MPNEPADSRDRTTSHRRKEASCIPHFDALWFCYCEQPPFLPVSCEGNKRTSVLHLRDLNSAHQVLQGDLKSPTFHTGTLRAAPVHQFKQYYRVGNVDDCLSYWNDLYDCLRQRTKYRDLVCDTGVSPLSYAQSCAASCLTFMPHVGNCWASRISAPSISIEKSRGGTKVLAGRVWPLGHAFKA